MVAQPRAQREQRPKPSGLSRLTVAGYKSIFAPVSIRIAPLTLLAGANSSGKSSMMQPILLLKQTLEASYDPGAFLLRGPNVQLTSADQLFSNCGRNRRSDRLSVRLETEVGDLLHTVIGNRRSGGLEVLETERKWQDGQVSLTSRMDSAAIASSLSQPFDRVRSFLLHEYESEAVWVTARRRCFLDPAIDYADQSMRKPFPIPLFYDYLEESVTNLLHLPGLRGSPERTYPYTAVESSFPGLFPAYTASVIAQWQDEKSFSLIEQMNGQMGSLGLTDTIRADRLSDTDVELRVGRVLSRVGVVARDTVSIADVGLGVSQTLPVVVALLVARPGQVVYIEQPEIHLHPKAQFKLAAILVQAANRGVKVIVETHSSIVLLGIQAEVAESDLDPGDVALHWFSRDRFGQTSVVSSGMDGLGAFGEWPEDFSDVYLEAQGRYLDAVEKRTEAR